MNHRHRPDEIGQIVMRHQVLHRGHSRTRRLFVEPEHDDPAMGSRWVRLNVAAPTAQRENDASLTIRGGKDLRIGTTSELLVEHRVSLDPERGKPAGQRDREPLVELDLHGAMLNGTSSSRANRAP